MLTLFVAMGLLECRGGVFNVTPVAREHLVKSSPWFIGPYYAALKDRPVCKDFVEVLRSDRVANIGGGSGIYSCALLAANSHLRATVLEKAPVHVVAAKAVAERGYSNRIAVVAADMLHGVWPDDADVHLLSNVLHDWGEPIVRELLARSFAALRPGGVLIIHDAFINAEKTGPLPVAAYSALLMHSTQGKCYSIREYESYLAAAGFAAVTYAPTTADRGRMLAHKPG
jgi:predicted O-methyltransferase YrrM